MNRFLRRILVGAAVLLFLAYFIVPLFRYNEGQGGELYDCYLNGDRKQADVFFEKLESVLKAEGFQPGSLADSGLAQVSPEGESYSGSYRGSLPFTIGVLRTGPNRNAFHVCYVWNFHRFSPVRDEMNKSTDAFSVFLRNWAESQGASDGFTRK